MAISIIDLLEVLHDKEIVHTNLSPDNIFLVNKSIRQMCFLNLYHCSWQTQETLNNKNIDEDFEDNISLFDIRTRSQEFISPEQIVLGKELNDIVQ
jgi:serine/threonine protein kinase